MFGSTASVSSNIAARIDGFFSTSTSRRLTPGSVVAAAIGTTAPFSAMSGPVTRDVLALDRRAGAERLHQLGHGLGGERGGVVGRGLGLGQAGQQADRREHRCDLGRIGKHVSTGVHGNLLYPNTQIVK